MKLIVALAVCVSALIWGSAASPSEQKSKNCNEVRTAYSSKGFNSNDVPNKGVYGKTPSQPAFLTQLSALSKTLRFVSDPETLVFLPPHTGVCPDCTRVWIKDQLKLLRLLTARAWSPKVHRACS